MKGVVRVLVVDDSAVARQTISRIISESNKAIEVVATAPNGKIALEKMPIPKFKPDVVTMDIMMPEMDGFETIGHIMDRFPTPVIIVSALSHKDIDAALSNSGMTAFESGAVEFVKKPNPQVSSDEKRFKRELIDKIINLSETNLPQALRGFDFKSFLKEDEMPKPIVTRETKRTVKGFHETLIVIGASTGGPRAVSLILSKIPPVFPPIIVVQHMPEEMVESWAKRLQSLYPHLKIKIPSDKEFIEPNRVYIAPGGRHCAVKDGRRFHLHNGPKVNFLRPAIDVTLISASEVYRENILGVILTGMGKDGYEGAKRIKAIGGKIFAEHESTCVIYGMPKVIIEGGLADRVAPLHTIPAIILGQN